MMSTTVNDNEDCEHMDVSSSPPAVASISNATENMTATVTPAATTSKTASPQTATASTADNINEEYDFEDKAVAKQDGRKVPRKRAPYGKRGSNQGVLETTNGVLDAVIGVSPFGIFCKGCKTKIAFSTFKNHIRDAHATCFTPSSVNYAAVSREYERLVDETKIDIILADSKAKTTNGEATTTDVLTSTSTEELLTAYLDGTDVVDRFQCTACYCLFDNKSNAKRHFLSMKTGCQEADLTIVKCRKTICYRAITLTDLAKMKRDSALAVVDDAYAKHQQLVEERNMAAAVAAEEEAEKQAATSSKSKKKKTPTKKKKATRKSSTKKDDQKKTAAKKKTTRKRPTAPAIESFDEERKRPPPPSPPGERSSSRLRKRRREHAGSSDNGNHDGGSVNQDDVEGGIMNDESNNLEPIEI